MMARPNEHFLCKLKQTLHREKRVVVEVFCNIAACYQDWKRWLAPFRSNLTFQVFAAIIFWCVEIAEKLALTNFCHPNMSQWMTQHAEMQLSVVVFPENPWHDCGKNCMFKFDWKHVHLGLKLSTHCGLMIASYERPSHRHAHLYLSMNSLVRMTPATASIFFIPFLRFIDSIWMSSKQNWSEYESTQSSMISSASFMFSGSSAEQWACKNSRTICKSFFCRRFSALESLNIEFEE